MLLIPGTKTFCRDECEEMIREIVYVCSALRSSDRTESQLYERCTFKEGWPRHEAMKNSRYVKIHAQLQRRMLMTVTDTRSDITAQLVSELLHVAMQRRLILLGPLTGGGKRLMVERRGPSVDSGWLKRAVYTNRLAVKHKVEGTQTACTIEPNVFVRETLGYLVWRILFQRRQTLFCKEWKGVYVQRCRPSPCWCLNRLLALFHIVIPVVYTCKYAGYKYHQHRHIHMHTHTHKHTHTHTLPTTLNHILLKRVHFSVLKSS